MKNDKNLNYLVWALKQHKCPGGSTTVMGSSCPTFSSRVSQSVIITRGPGTRPDTLDGCRHSRTAESVVCQVLGGGFLVFSFYHPQGFPSRGTTCRNLATICWLVGRDHLKTQTFPTVPACISTKQWGICGKPNLYSCCSMLIKMRQFFAKAKF